MLIGNKTNENINVTLSFRSSINNNYTPIEVSLIVELVPCPDHPGYYYSGTSKVLFCYHHDVVECYKDYSEIKRSYWFGIVNEKTITSLVLAIIVTLLTEGLQGKDTSEYLTALLISMNITGLALVVESVVQDILLRTTLPIVSM